MLKGLTRRIFATIFIGLFALTAYFSVHSYIIHIDTAEENMLQNLQGISKTLSAQMDANEFNMILKMFPNVDDIETNDQHYYYQRQHKILSTTQELLELNTPIYTLTYDSTKEHFFFGITSSDKPFYRHTYEHFPDGLLKNYKKGGVLPAYEDENGVWLSAFSPVKDGNNVIGLVVVDLPFEEFIAKARVELFKNISISLFMVLLLSLVIYRLLSKILDEDRKRRLLIRKKNSELSEKNKEITASIRYAKRIQDAILPSSQVVDKFIPNNFIYYKPRDIVAGDFYWFCTEGDDIYIACADCTGHGVPGAIVSIICSKALDSALKQFHLTEPAEILDQVSILVEDSFKQSEAEILDGMDICLCKINFKKELMTVSGANNPLYQICKDPESLSDHNIIIHKTDKQPIGKYAHKKPFTQTEIKLNKGDIFYLFTDGYADQFGGLRGKKYLYKAFKQLLVSISNQSMSEQKKSIDHAFIEWKGKEEQVDDVCIIGFRV